MGVITRTPRRGTAALGFVLLALSLSACVPGEPLIPESVHSQVTTDDRMRNYDLAWQEIRALNVEIEQGNAKQVAEQSLMVIARMHRLGEGSASRLRDRDTRLVLEEERGQAVGQTDVANREALETAGLALQESFDEGDFQEAKQFGLRVYAISSHIADPDS